ncbi:hypothetical protein Pcinc_024930 [Petrolisthes cinctipes]|uniref:THAP9-like helix-turn-helix domain-containing protein n=1 Tax=Petrolisthes cinctipes TaxID=88211 RepID=A0AAE1F9K6_PETCI|nr:hypothetical protein Pcinc_024930 [Petrolisthes cinctipes]
MHLHFDPKAYERNLKYELLGLPIPTNQIRLQNDAVPTLNLPSNSIAENSAALVNRETRMERRRHKRLVHDIEREGAQAESSEELRHAEEIEELQRQLCGVMRERDALLAEKKGWEKERLSLHEQLQNAYVEATARARYKLGMFFSSSQVDFFLSGAPVRCWTDSDVSEALTLRSLSPKVYRYLREQKKFPLPSASTLHRWVN